MPAPAAIRRCEELIRSDGSDRGLEAAINRCLAPLVAMAGRLDEARELARQSDRVLEELYNPTHSTFYLSLAAEAKELVGDRAGAEQDLLEMWRRLGPPGERTDVRAMEAAARLAHLYCNDGRWDDAERCLEYGAEVPLPDAFRVWAALRLPARARVEAQDGDLERAYALAKRGVELAESGDMLNITARAWLVLAEIERRNGRLAEADAAVGAALGLYEQKGNVVAAAALRAPPHAVAR
jgi:tetratricopeptide (TPR) repeat protein